MVGEKAVGVPAHGGGEGVAGGVEGAFEDAVAEGAFCVPEHFFDAGAVVVAVAAEDEEAGGFDEADDVLQVAVAQDAGDDEVELDAGHLVVGGGAATADAGLDAPVEDGGEEGGAAAVGVADEADAAGVDLGEGLEEFDAGGGVVEDFAEEGLPADQAVVEFAEVGTGGGVGVGAALFEADGVGGKGDEAALGELAGVGHVGIAFQADDFAFAEEAVAGVLVEADDGRTLSGYWTLPGYWALPGYWTLSGYWVRVGCWAWFGCWPRSVVVRQAEEGADALAGLDGVFDGLAEEGAAVDFFEEGRGRRRFVGEGAEQF